MNKSFWIDPVQKAVAALLGVALLALTGCGGGGTGSTSPQTPTGDLKITPSGVTILPGDAPVQLVISGGLKPYTLTSSQPNLIAVPGTIGGDADGRFTIVPAFVPAANAVVVITVRDALQKIVVAEVGVNAKVILPPDPPPALVISPTSADSGIGVPVTFIITGGVGPYSVTSSQPSIVPNPIAVDGQGRFTVTAISNPPVDAVVSLTIRDSRNSTVNATLKVRNLALAVSPSTATTSVGIPATFQVSGGSAPYTVTSSSPSIIPNPIVDVNGRFTVTPLVSPATPASVVLTIRDGSGNQVAATVTVTPTPVPVTVTLSITPTDITVAANTPVTFTITGGTGPYTVISSLPDLVPNPVTIDSAGRFTLRATTAPTIPTAVLITIRDAAQNVVKATMTILPAPTTTPIPLSVLPKAVIVYYNTPASLTVFGGTAPYQAFSSNPTVLPVARNVVGDQIVLAPANVAADTTVTITVTDAAGNSATADVTVKPAPLLNTITITPTPASPGDGCLPAVCAGQTGSVSVRVRNLAGAGIAGRAVRFENVQGNYQFYTSGPGLPDTFANSITVTTDQDGLAIVRIKADVNAPTQVALIRATELTTGNVVNGSFTIAQFTDGTGTLTAIPKTVSLTGATSSTCASNFPVTYYIFGGTPPYRIQSTVPNFAQVIPPIVQTNGGGFTAVVSGLVCTDDKGVQFTITDATGRTIAVTLVNKVGTGNPATNFEAIQVVPGSISTPLLTCGQAITEQIVGGRLRLADGSAQDVPFVVSSTSPYITATVAGRVITITRNTTQIPTAELPSNAVIRVSNSITLETFTVALGNSSACAGAGPGPTPGGTSQITFSTAPLGLGCVVGSTATVTMTGGTGAYTATADPGISAAVSGSTLTVTRTTAALPGSASLAVTATNSTGAGTLLVAPSGAGC